MKKWMLIAGVVVVLAVIGAGVYAMTVGKRPVDTATNSTDLPTTQTAGTVTIDDACAVVKKESLDAAFGLKFKDGVKENDSTGPAGSTTKSCKYDEQNDGSVTAMMKATNVSVQAESYPSVQAAKNALSATRNTDKVGGKVYFVRTDAPGIGDEAFFFQGQAPAVLKTEEYLYARKANVVYHFVAVKLDGIDHAAAKQAITAVAAPALN